MQWNALAFYVYSPCQLFILFYFFYFSKLFLEGSVGTEQKRQLLKWILVRFMKSVGKEREKLQCTYTGLWLAQINLLNCYFYNCYYYL